MSLTMVCTSSFFAYSLHVFVALALLGCSENEDVLEMHNMTKSSRGAFPGTPGEGGTGYREPNWMPGAGLDAGSRDPDPETPGWGVGMHGPEESVWVQPGGTYVQPGGTPVPCDECKFKLKNKQIACLASCF